MESVALFGGSFDPPHIGHKAIVEKVLNLKEIDKVVIMPTYLNPFKLKSHATAQQRLTMVKAMFKKFKHVEVSDFEVQQQQKVPSITTVKHLLKKCKKIYLIIGADNLQSLPQWQDYDELEQLVTFVVASRNNIKIPNKYIKLDVDENISSTQIREREHNLQNRIKRITQVLDTNKAESIEAFDLSDKDYIVDTAIIASSLGTRHTLALLDHLKKDLKSEETINNVDESGDWVVVDLGDILIHIMTPEYRVKYDMETFLSQIGEAKEAL